MLRFETKKIVDVSDWDSLVEETYGRPYSFQQQDGCQSRGIVHLHVSKEEYEDNFHRESIPEKVNGEIMGVTFKAWLERDPKKPIPNQTADYQLGMFYERNFYPDIQMVANDMCKKGLVEEGDYIINIDW